MRRAWKAISGQESIIVPIYKQTAGEFPPVTFTDLRDVYVKDPDVYNSVNFIANRALSKGFHVECSAEAPDHEEAERFLEDWLKNVRWGDARNERGYEPLLRIMARELGWGGTSMLEMLDPWKIDALAQVQLSSIWRYQRDEYGNLRWIWQYPHINPRPLTPSRYVIFQWNVVDRNPFGYGLVHSLSQWRNGPNGGLIPPLYMIKWQMEDDIRRRLHRYGMPRSIFSFKGISQAEAKQYAEVLKDPDADTSFGTNADIDIKMDTPQGRANFAPDFEFIDTRIQSALGTAFTRLLTTNNYNLASSKTAAELGDIIVWDLQTVIKHTTENEILMRVLEQSNYDANLLAPRFEWNIPDEPKEYTIADVLKAATPDPSTGKAVITPMEARAILREFAKWELEDDAPAVGPVVQPGDLIVNPQQLPQVGQPGFKASGAQTASTGQKLVAGSIGSGAAGAASGVATVDGTRRVKGAANKGDAYATEKRR